MRLRLWFCLLAAGAAAAGADHGFGPFLPPRPLPAISITDQGGVARPLPELLRGRRAAIQFIFTNCSTACPLLGSLFHAVEKRVADAKPAPLLLSISVDPQSDSPDQLRQWLTSHKAGEWWRAGTVAAKDLPALLEAFGIKTIERTAHSTQVFYVSSQGEIISRTTALPEAAAVAGELRRTP